MSCAQAHWVGSKPIRRVMQLKLHKPTMAIGYSLFMCARHVDSTNQGRTQSALEFCPIHCPNGRLGQDLGFGGSAFALKLPELLNRNLVAVRAKLGQTSC